MKNKIRHGSIYKRTSLAAFASVMVAFTILSFIYYGIMNERVKKLQTKRIYAIALTLREEIEDLYKNDSMPQMAINEKIDLIAKSSSSYIWLVREDGILIHASKLPQTIEDECLHLGGGVLKMPKRYIFNKPLNRKGVVWQNSELANIFFDEKIDWVTTLLPIYSNSETQQFSAVLQIHLPSFDQYNLSWFISNGVGIAFLAALIISTALALILMNYLTLPLETLSDVANKVMLGDYSARVRYGDLNTSDSREHIEDADDITNLMHTFNAMVARLESVNAEQRDMISCLSHDMKTPLTSIIGFSEGILDGTVPEDAQEKYLKIIQQEALRLKNLLSDINMEGTLGNFAANNFTDFDINNLFIRTIDSLENQLKAKNLAVEIQFDDRIEGGLYVTADEEQISRVIYNLVSNAIKFCRPDDTIRVSTNYPEGSLFVSCSVEDSGPGIPAEHRNDVFGRFYKLDKSRGNREGSGLGLYICRKILANHGQQIYLSHNGDLGGAKFVFTLPAGANQKHSKGNKQKHGGWSAFNRKTGKKDSGNDK